MFKILESNNSSDSLEDDFSSSSNSCYQFADDSSDSPNIKIGCRDSCCNVINFINTLTKGKDVFDLCNQQYFDIRCTTAPSEVSSTTSTDARIQC